jgi:hypothetical protein
MGLGVGRVKSEPAGSGGQARRRQSSRAVGETVPFQTGGTTASINLQPVRFRLATRSAWPVARAGTGCRRRLPPSVGRPTCTRGHTRQPSLRLVGEGGHHLTAEHGPTVREDEEGWDRAQIRGDCLEGMWKVH